MITNFSYDLHYVLLSKIICYYELHLDQKIMNRIIDRTFYKYFTPLGNNLRYVRLSPLIITWKIFLASLQNESIIAFHIP